MDISQLELKINKNQAVNDLKSVEKQLDKTGKAATGLIDTLKNIGLTVGFGKLVKDSLQLNNQFTALSNKFESIFSGGFDTKLFSDLKTELSLSDSSLKSILATTGQFAKGLGQSSQFVKNFSADLTKAAADYAAYQGKTSAADVNDFARKFAKATLGEVGELKEIGIIIDTTSTQFQNAVKTFQETTGATEAQAKQMEILKQIMEQTQIASGSAAQNMNDGWTQLNKLFEQFKEILGEVGEIFSSVFGPGLRVLNSILEIPFVKSTTAWVVALGGVIVGYSSLKSLLTIISDNLKGILSTQDGTLPKQNQILEFQKRHANLVTQTANEYDRIYKTAIKTAGIKAPSGKTDWFKLNSKQKKQFEADLEIVATPLSKQFKDVQAPFNKLKEEIRNSGLVLDDFINNLPLLTNGFELMIRQIFDFQHVFKSIADMGKSSKNVSKSFLNLGALFAWFTPLIKTLFGKLEKLWQLIKTFGLPVIALTSALASLTIVADATTRMIQKNESALDALANSGVANAIVDMFWGVFDGIMEVITLGFWDSKSNKEAMRAFTDQVHNVFMRAEKDAKRYGEELKNIKFDNLIKGLLPAEAISNLESKKAEIKSSINDTVKLVSEATDKYYEALRKSNLIAGEENYDAYSDEDRKAALANLKDAEQSLKNIRQTHASQLRELGSVEDQIKQKQQQLIQTNLQFANSLDKLRLELDSAFEQFNYGYKDGKFGNYTEEQRDINREERIADLRKRIAGLSNKETLTSLKSQQSAQQELFKLTQEKAKYELDSLMKQREAAIDNLNIMNDFIKQTIGLKQTAQTAVESESIEALTLQSRRFQTPSSSEFAPLIEQQKQIKEIEKQMLQKQDGSEKALSKIYQQLVETTKKIGTGSGATTFDLVVIN